MSDRTNRETSGPFTADLDYLRSVINHIEHPTLIIDREYRAVLANEKLITRTCDTDVKPLGKCYEISKNRTRPCSGRSTPCPLERAFTSKSTVTMRHSYHNNLYNKVYVEISATPIFDETGEVVHVIETCRDASPDSGPETALRKSEAQYRSLFEQSSDAIFILKADGPQTGRILSANRAACLMYGYSEDSFLRLSITDLDTPDQAAKAPKRIKEILEGSTLRIETTHQRKDGSVFPVEVSASRMSVDGRQFVLAIYRDISSRKEAEQDRDTMIRELQHISQTDGLTGLFNRQHLDSRLSGELERARRYNTPLSLIIFDIDHFKNINDTYGHITGDIILQTTASIIKETIRGTDLAGRFGGDEFVIILVETDIHVGLQVAERLRQRIEREQVTADDGRTTAFSVSLGICELDNNITSAGEFIAKADTALYAAKRGSRNTVCRIEDSN